MLSFKEIIDYWPSVGEMAADVGVSKEAVKKWRQRDSIPADKWAAVLLAAQQRGYQIKPTDLITIASDVA